MARIGQNSRGEVMIENAIVLRTAGKAMLIDINGAEHWLPYSQIVRTVASDGNAQNLVVTQWIAEQKGLLRALTVAVDTDPATVACDLDTVAVMEQVRETEQQLRGKLEEAQRERAAADRRANRLKDDLAAAIGRASTAEREATTATAAKKDAQHKLAELQQKLDAAERAVATIGKMPASDIQCRFDVLEID